MVPDLPMKSTKEIPERALPGQIHLILQSLPEEAPGMSKGWRTLLRSV